MKNDDSAKMAVVAVLSGGLTFGGTHLLEEEYGACMPLIINEAREQQQECAIKLLDCKKD